MVPRKTPFKVDRGTTPLPEAPRDVLNAVPPRHERLKEILGPFEDKLLRKHLPRMFSLIKNES